MSYAYLEYKKPWSQWQNSELSHHLLNQFELQGIYPNVLLISYTLSFDRSMTIPNWAASSSCKSKPIELIMYQYRADLEYDKLYNAS